MRSGLLIAQISDCHLSADPQQDYRGVNPHQNLQALVPAVKAMKPDLIMATGDLSEDGSIESYLLLKAYMAQIGTPVMALPGNHDEPQLLDQIFPGSPVDTIAVSETNAWQIVRLNSCLPGKPEGFITDRALADLEQLLAFREQKHTLLAVHHQPILIGNPWIDKYPLINPQNLLQLIDRFSQVKAVIWGHVHHVFEAQRNGTVMLGGPSSAVNSLPDVARFTADDSGPACRWLELKDDGTIETGIIKPETLA